MFKCVNLVTNGIQNERVVPRGDRGGKSEKDRERLKTSLNIGSSIFETGWPQRDSI